MRIPANKQWVQPNNSDNEGSIWASFNIDLCENVGRLRLGKRLYTSSDGSDSADFSGVPVGFRIFASKIYTALGVNASGYPFKTSGIFLDSTFVKDTATGTPSTINSQYSDIEILAGQLFVTTKSKAVYYLDSTGATWGTFDLIAGTDNNTPKLMTPYANRMYFTYGGAGKITSCDNATTPSPAGAASSSVPYTLDLGFDVATAQITFIKAASDRIWIGTMNRLGEKAYMYEWDGVSSTAKGYKLPSSGALSCVIKDDIPWIMDVRGKLMAFNQSGFVEMAGLNIENVRELYNPYGTDNLRFIHPNGMAVVNGKINLLIDGRNYDGALGTPDTFTQNQAIPSGVWEYDQKYGLVHKHSASIGHLANTVDYGQLRLKGVGGMKELTAGQNPTSGGNGSFLIGASTSNDVSSSNGTLYGVMYDDIIDTTIKTGYFITPKIDGSNITEIWQKVYTTYKTLLNSADKFVVKYRIADDVKTEHVIKVTSTSQFTTTDDLSSYAVGDEITIVQGYSGGICCHITVLPAAVAGTTTVTVDETLIAGTPKTSKMWIQKWTKAGTVNDQVTSFAESSTDGQKAPWVQFKIWMKWTGKNEINYLETVTAPAQQAK